MEAKIEILRHKIISSNNLGAIADYFLVQFPGHSEFEQGCHKISSEEKQTLMLMFQKVIEQRLVINPGKKTCVLLRFKNTQFIHGFISYPNMLCTVNFFDRELVGFLTCICHSQSDRAQYFRLMGFKTDKPLHSIARPRVIQKGEFYHH